MANILIVEDNESLRLAYTSFLKQEGHQLTTAATVDEALAWLGKNTPDIVLLDMLIPKKNGIELLEAYDVITAHPTVKVIGFSNYSEIGIQEQAIRLGVKLYLTKAATTPKELVDTIDKILNAS